MSLTVEHISSDFAEVCAGDRAAILQVERRFDPLRVNVNGTKRWYRIPVAELAALMPEAGGERVRSFLECSQPKENHG